MQTNIIKRQVLDFTLESENDSFAFQNKLSHIYYDDMLPIIDKYCSALSDSSHIQRIERLEIDLGGIDFYNLKSELKEKMAEQFPEKLADALQRYDEFSHNIAEDERNIHIYGYINNNLPVSYLVTSEYKNFELLDFFIKKGRLPWWIKRNEIIDIIKILETEMHNNPERIRNWMNQVAKDNKLINRLVNQFPDRVLGNILGLMQEREHAEQIYNLIQDLIQILTNDKMFTKYHFYRIRYEIWIVFFTVYFGSMKKISADEIVQMIMKHVTEKYNADYMEMYSYVQKKLNLKKYNLYRKEGKSKRSIETGKHEKEIILFKSMVSELVMELKNVIIKNDIIFSVDNTSEYLERELQHIFEISEGIKQSATDDELIRKYYNKLKAILIHILSFEISEQDKIYIEKKLRIIDPRYDINKEDIVDKNNQNMINEKPLITNFIYNIATNNASNSILPTPESNYVNRFSDSEEIYVYNAGIILFWPYLNKFFELCSLVKDNQFINQEKQERAVFLLQYLVVGRMEFPEYDLMLNKILCGLEEETPLISNAYLTEDEIQKSNNLIEGVIQNWSALKNISAQGLREMFLLREGVISRRDGNYVLRVEEKSYDVLIDKMPWGISTIKLPWMQDLLFVEWRL